MEIDLASQVRNQLAQSLGVSREEILCTLDGNIFAITVTGEHHGRGVKSAYRRRQQARRIAKRLVETGGYQLSFTFAIQDAVSAMERLVRTTAEVVLGTSPDDVYVNVGRTGKTSVLLTMTRVEDNTNAQLTRAISSGLANIGLSLNALSLVSPMREDVSDARLLRAAKILSPCDAGAVARQLKQLGAFQVTADVVHRRLDVLRKKGLLVYLGNRRFALTLKGLATVPTSASRRDSSDIERALALAKSKW